MISFCKQQRSSADNFVVTQIVPPTSIRIYRYACCTGTWIILYCLYCTSYQSRKRTTVRNIVEKCTKLSETLIIAKSQHYRKKSGVIAKSQALSQKVKPPPKVSQKVNRPLYQYLVRRPAGLLAVTCYVPCYVLRAYFFITSAQRA